MKLVRSLVLIAALVFSGVACGGDDAGDDAGNTDPNTVQATDGAKFEPASLTVSTGTTVTWKSGPAQAHTATSKAGAPAAFDVNLPAGQSGTFTFTTAGTYPYFCKIHGESQSGTIVVQ